MNWCGAWDLNPQALRHRLLRPACMPFHQPRTISHSVRPILTRSAMPMLEEPKRIHVPSEPSAYRPAEPILIQNGEADAYGIDGDRNPAWTRPEAE